LNKGNELNLQGPPFTCRRGRHHSNSQGRKLADILFVDVSKQLSQFRLKALHSRKFFRQRISVFTDISCPLPTRFSSGNKRTFLFALLSLKISLPYHDNKLLQFAPLLRQLTAVKIRADFFHKILELTVVQTVTSLYLTFQQAPGGEDG